MNQNRSDSSFIPFEEASAEKIQHALLIRLSPDFVNVAVAGPGDEVKFLGSLVAGVELLSVLGRGVGILTAGEHQHRDRPQSVDVLRRRQLSHAQAQALLGHPDDAGSETAEPGRIARPNADTESAGQVVIKALQNDGVQASYLRT